MAPGLLSPLSKLVGAQGLITVRLIRMFLPFSPSFMPSGELAVRYGDVYPERVGLPLCLGIRQRRRCVLYVDDQADSREDRGTAR